MKASELLGQTHFKALIYGDSGAGKTCFAASMPGPIEYWDFDHKISSAVRYLQTQNKAAQLDEIEVYQFANLPLMERIPAWEKRLKAINDCVQQKKPLPFKTLVVDSITTLSHHLMEDYIHRSQTGIKRPLPGINAMQDYQLYEKHMTRVITGLLGLPANVVVLGHVTIEKDEATGIISKRCLASGKALPEKLPIWFEEVYVALAKPDGSRVLLTQPLQNYVARCQRGLPKEVPMKVEEVLK